MNEGRVEIIAEIGQAHEGSVGMAHSYIDAVADCKVDTVKFQMHIAEDESSVNDSFRVNFSYEDKTRYDYWKRMEFSVEHWKDLKDHSEKAGLNFLCTPFSIRAVEILKYLGIKKWKIGSGDTYNRPLLRKIAETGLPVYLSTGMSDYNEIKNSIQILLTGGCPITLFHCITQYPVKPENILIEEILILKKKFGFPVGFSDHSGEIYPGIIASFLGANVVEVHATFSKKSFGPDISASLDLSQLEELVKGIRFVDRMLSTANTRSEIVKNLHITKKLFQRSLFTKNKIEKGTTILEKDIKYVKPGGGLSDVDLEKVIGKKTKQTLEKDHKLSLNDFE